MTTHTICGSFGNSVMRYPAALRLCNFAVTSVVCVFPERCLLTILNVVCTHRYPLRSQPINRRKPSRSLPHFLSLSLSISHSLS